MNPILEYVKSNHDIVEAISTFAAAVAAFFSLVVATIAIKQAKGAVRPLPFVEVNDYVNDVAVSVRNFGVGPLTILSLTVTNTKTGDVKDNVIDFMPTLKGPTQWATFVSQNIVGRPIAPGEEMRLVQYCGDNEDDIRRIRAALSELTVTAKTKDIYDRRVKPCSRHLDWFARY